MKNLIVAFTFAIFSLALPLSMAQQATENDVEVKVEKIAEAPVDKDDKGFSVTIDMDDAEEVEEEIKKVVVAVHKIFGDDVGSELESELGKLSNDERQEIRNKIRGAFSDKDFDFGGGSSGGGIGFGEFVIAMTAIILSLGLPVIILVLFFVYSSRKRKQKMDLISSYLEAGQPVPEHVMAEFGGSVMSGDATFRSGLTYSLVGVALFIVIFAADGWRAATLGLIPLGIGIARLITWKQAKENTNISQNTLPDNS